MQKARTAFRSNPLVGWGYLLGRECNLPAGSLQSLVPWRCCDWHQARIAIPRPVLLFRDWEKSPLACQMRLPKQGVKVGSALPAKEIPCAQAQQCELWANPWLIFPRSRTCLGGKWARRAFGALAHRGWCPFPEQNTPCKAAAHSVLLGGCSGIGHRQGPPYCSMGCFSALVKRGHLHATCKWLLPWGEHLGRAVQAREVPCHPPEPRDLWRE